MKSSKAELAAVAAAHAKQAKSSAAAASLSATLVPAGGDKSADIWHQTTKVVVPAWFGQCSAMEGHSLSKTFTAAGLLALVCVGQSGRKLVDGKPSPECEVGMQIKLRPSGFDREEARDLAEFGFWQLQEHKLVRMVKKPTVSFPYAYFVLSKKGQKWYDLIERSAGCAQAPVQEA